MSSLSAHEAAASKSYMDDAEQLLRGIVANCPTLRLWRGKMPEKFDCSREGDEPTLYDTLIVHEVHRQPEAGIWSEYVLYTQRLRRDRVTIDLTNHVCDQSCGVPFGGGCSPVEELEKVASHLLYHARIEQVRAFKDVLEKQLRKIIDDFEVEPVALGLGESQLIRFDIIRGRFEWRRFCVAFVIDHENKAGVWDKEYSHPFTEVSRPYIFDSTGANIWLDEELLEDNILEALTREVA